MDSTSDALVEVAGTSPMELIGSRGEALYRKCVAEGLADLRDADPAGTPGGAPSARDDSDYIQGLFDVMFHHGLFCKICHCELDEECLRHKGIFETSTQNIGTDLQEVCVSYGTFSALIGSNEKANGRVVKMWAIKTLEMLCDRVQACLNSDIMDTAAVRLNELEQIFDSMRLAVELTDRDQDSAIAIELEDAKYRAACAATTARVMAWYFRNSGLLEGVYSKKLETDWISELKSRYDLAAKLRGHENASNRTTFLNDILESLDDEALRHYPPTDDYMRGILTHVFRLPRVNEGVDCMNGIRVKVAFLIYILLDINGGDMLECSKELKISLSITDQDWIDCHRFFWLDANETILKKVWKIMPELAAVCVTEKALNVISSRSDQECPDSMFVQCAKSSGDFPVSLITRYNLTETSIRALIRTGQLIEALQILRLKVNTIESPKDREKCQSDLIAYFYRQCRELSGQTLVEFMQMPLKEDEDAALIHLLKRELDRNEGATDAKAGCILEAWLLLRGRYAELGRFAELLPKADRRLSTDIMRARDALLQAARPLMPLDTMQGHVFIAPVPSASAVSTVVKPTPSASFFSMNSDSAPGRTSRSTSTPHRLSKSGAGLGSPKLLAGPKLSDRKA